MFLRNGRYVCCGISFALLTAMPINVHAEIHTVSAVGEYTMSDYEEPQIAELRALDYAKRSAVEKAGVYVKTYTKSKQMQISEDEVNAITSSKINISNQKVSRQLDTAGNIRIRMEITATVDTADVDSVLAEETSKRNESIERYDYIKAKSEEQDRKIAELKKKITNMTDNVFAVEAELRERQECLDREFMSNQKMAELKKNYKKDEAILHEAIRLNPKNYLPYYYLGLNVIPSVHPKTNEEKLKVIEEEKSAIKYYGMSLALNPDFSDAYVGKSSNYYLIALKYSADTTLSRKYKRLARLNAEKAISVDPNNIHAYVEIGDMTAADDPNGSLAAFEKAFDLMAQKIAKKPQDIYGYDYRAFTYSHSIGTLFCLHELTVSNYSNKDFFEDICKMVSLNPLAYSWALDYMDELDFSGGLFDIETADIYRAKLLDVTLSKIDDLGKNGIIDAKAVAEFTSYTYEKYKLSEELHKYNT